MVHKASSSSLTFPHFPVRSREVIIENIIVISSLKSECLWYMGPARGQSPRYLLWRLSWANKFYIILSGRERRTRRLPWPCQTHTKSNLDCDRVTFKVKQYKSNRDDVALKCANMTGGSKFFITGSTIHIHTCIAWMEIWTLYSEKVVSSYLHSIVKIKKNRPPIVTHCAWLHSLSD